LDCGRRDESRFDCVTLGVLLAGASWVAFHSDENSRHLIAAARHHSRQALNAERAISEFLRERESIGEYLVLPSSPLAREVQDRRRAFEVLAVQVQDHARCRPATATAASASMCQAKLVVELRRAGWFSG
jgi:hypothetical protein